MVVDGIGNAVPFAIKRSQILRPVSAPDYSVYYRLYRRRRHGRTTHDHSGAVDVKVHGVSSSRQRIEWNHCAISVTECALLLIRELGYPHDDVAFVNCICLAAKTAQSTEIHHAIL